MAEEKVIDLGKRWLENYNGDKHCFEVISTTLFRFNTETGKIESYNSKRSSEWVEDFERRKFATKEEAIEAFGGWIKKMQEEYSAMLCF